MGNSPSLVPIDLGALFDDPLKRFLAPVEPAIQKLLLVDRLGGMLQSVLSPGPSLKAWRTLARAGRQPFFAGPGGTLRAHRRPGARWQGRADPDQADRKSTR